MLDTSHDLSVKAEFSSEHPHARKVTNIEVDLRGVRILTTHYMPVRDI